jgi:NAD(P)-dependent dehydrogenase (short-subunit alcohol dehydrogenase family)
MGMLSGKTVLVTGSSSGIGRAAVVRFAGEGATVIAAARREKMGEELVAEVGRQGGRVHFLRTDIADGDSIDALFAMIAREHGRLDGAFNNAGIESVAAMLPDTPVETYEEVFKTNVQGTWLCLRHEMRMMIEQKSGAIVNTSSMAGVRGLPHSSVYVAAKHAIVGMSKSAALDVAALGIRVNCLCPGGVRSEMSARWLERLPGGEAQLAATIPMKRLGEPLELANVALFLLSDLATYMTGAIIEADGGFGADHARAEA